MTSTRETCYERRNHQSERNKEMSQTARNKSIGNYSLRSESHEGKTAHFIAPAKGGLFRAGSMDKGDGIAVERHN